MTNLKPPIGTFCLDEAPIEYEFVNAAEIRIHNIDNGEQLTISVVDLLQLSSSVTDSFAAMIKGSLDGTS